MRSDYAITKQSIKAGAKVSVIVPVYNVENYVAKCLASISAQDYQNLEIIVVDDGSTDQSGEICEAYAQQDPRVQVIHQTNGGLSAARNTGLEQLTGEYVCFIDSDDWIEPDFISLLLTGISMCQAEIAVLKLKKIADEKKLTVLTTTDPDWQVMERKTAMKNLFTNNKIGYSANNKLFASQLFQTIRFPVGKLMEDKATTYRLIDQCQRVAINRSLKYHYFQSPDSILRGRFNPQKFDSFTIHEMIMTFIDQHYPEVSVNVRTRFVYEAIRMMMSMIENNYTQAADFKKCYAVLQKYQSMVQQDPDFSPKLKRLTTFLLNHPKLPLYLAQSRLVGVSLTKLEMLR